MQVFYIRYRNAQGALMRILNAVSRRGLDLASVHAEYAGQGHAVTLMLQVTHKQIGQLYREWYAIVDVIKVLQRGSAARRKQPGRRIRQHRQAWQSSRRARHWLRFRFQVNSVSRA